MDSTEKDYAAFERAMDEERIYRVIPGFPEICRRIGADPVSLDRVIHEELGFRGRELVERYRRSDSGH